jgi:methylenetetrahydrofolate dehydrogenase (NADP+)/methenyltetrahydrofolate cyclohydrolase
MAARVIDGKAVGAAVRARVASEVAAYEAECGRTPMLVTVIVGDDPASEIYVRNKHSLRGGGDALVPSRPAWGHQ